MPVKSMPNKRTAKQPVRSTRGVRKTRASSSGSSPSLLKRSRQISTLLAVLTVLVLGSVYVYARHASKQPDNILKWALSRTMQAHSAEVSLRYAGNTAIPDSNVLHLSGVVTDRGKFDITGSYSKAGQGVGVALKSVDGKDAYVQLSDTAKLRNVLGENAADYAITDQRNPLTALEGRWLLVPASLKDTILLNRPADGKTSYILSAGDKKKLAEIYRRHEFLRVSNVYPDELVDSKISYHYRVGIDVDELTLFLRTAQRDVAKLHLSDKQVESIIGIAVRAGTVEAWIAKDDKRFNKMIYRSSDATVTDVALTMKNYNHTVRIETPADAMPLFEVLSSLVLDQSVIPKTE